MKPAPFGYHAPGSLPEAVALVAGLGDDAKVLAGGQSLIPVLAMRLSRFDHLADLGGVPELAGISRTRDGVRVGAMTVQADVARSAELAAVPLLRRATPLIGHFQIRNRGTLGGSVAHADPAAEYPAVTLALDATVEATVPAGVRRIPPASSSTRRGPPRSNRTRSSPRSSFPPGAVVSPSRRSPGGTVTWPSPVSHVDFPCTTARSPAPRSPGSAWTRRRSASTPRNAR
ncbi:hypothetical protein GCM10017788_37250 [Amycolatopsis acidiphila]|nr:hypothetical protein GCM10017788_37250 [Amycolatopsis acidiphila]